SRRPVVARPCSVRRGVHAPTGRTADRVSEVRPRCAPRFAAEPGSAKGPPGGDTGTAGHTKEDGPVPRRQARVQGLMAAAVLAVCAYTQAKVPRAGRRGEGFSA